MIHESLPSQNLISSALPLPAFAGLVGGEGLYEGTASFVACSDSPSPLTSHNFYDGQLRPVAEFDGSGALVSQFVYATHINVPDYIVKGATTYRVITDHLGSLRFVIDVSNGTIAQRIDYDDWGNVLVNTASDFTPFGFAGGIYDSQTKLVRFGARDYDAETGRWTSKDPILFNAHDGNLFAYLANDPINGVDAEGLAQLCYRRFDWNLGTAFYYGLLPLFPYSLITGHCYMSFSDGTTYSYQPSGIEEDKLHGTIFKVCSPIIMESECCTEGCLKSSMGSYAAGASFDWVSHNCCDVAKGAIKQCQCKEPLLSKIFNYGF